MWSTAEPPSIQSLLYRGEHATEADATVKVPKVSVAEHRTEAAVKVPAAVCGALQYIILQNHLLYRSLSGQNKKIDETFIKTEKAGLKCQ